MRVATMPAASILGDICTIGFDCRSGINFWMNIRMEWFVVGFFTVCALFTFAHGGVIFGRRQTLWFSWWQNIAIAIDAGMAILFAIVLIFYFTVCYFTIARWQCWCRWSRHRIVHSGRRRGIRFVDTSSCLIQLHAVTVWIDVTPTILARLFDENLIGWSQCTQKAFIDWNVQALSIRVYYVLLRPLPQALILSLWMCEENENRANRMQLIIKLIEINAYLWTNIPTIGLTIEISVPKFWMWKNTQMLPSFLLHLETENELFFAIDDILQRYQLLDSRY